MNAECRIYAACLASYNNGVLHGRWIDCEGKDADDLSEEVSAMLRDSKFPNVEVDCPTCEGPVAPPDCPTCHGTGNVPSAEEFAIHDHEGFGDLIGESSSLEEVAALSEVLSEADDPDLLIGFMETQGLDPDEALEAFQDAYAGSGDTLTAWVEEFLEDTGTLERIPENLRHYFDAEAYARDMRLGGDIFTIEQGGTTHVFWNH